MFTWVAEYPVTTVMFLVVLFCLLQSWLLKKDFFSPPTVYCFSQCITLGIAYLQIDKTMTDFKPLTWMIWIGALLAFTTGSFLARLVAKQKGWPDRVSEPSPEYTKNYRWNLHVALSLIPFAIFLFGVYGIVQHVGTLLLLSDNPARFMTKEGGMDLGYTPVYLSAAPLCVLLFGAASFKRFNPERGLRIFSRCMVVVSIVLNMFAYPNRGNLFLSLAVIIIMFNYLHKRVSAAWIIFCLALALAAFIGLGSIRNQYSGNSVENMAASAVMELPYKYVANNYWNLDYAVNPPVDREYHPHTYGIDFFHGMFEFLVAGPSFRRSFHWDGLFNESIEKIHGFNTASYLWEVYKDLYMPGVFILPFLVGLALSTLHLKLCGAFTPRQVIFYSMFIYFIGWWFFTPGYKQGIYWFWVYIIFFITTVSVKGVKKAESLPADAPVPDKVDGQLQAEQ
ncbi:MAG: oligosaccharide repeat unit polymerase [Fibrobacter sp.]|nr:oligosaccharide repeat unit polymerase [Fibrobacter sp.]